MSRLWTNPPTLPDGNLDYAALTLAEVREDLAETLSDLVLNGGQEDAAPLLDAIEGRYSRIASCRQSRFPRIG